MLAEQFPAMDAGPHVELRPGLFPVMCAGHFHTLCPGLDAGLRPGLCPVMCAGHFHILRSEPPAGPAERSDLFSGLNNGNCYSAGPAV